MARKKKSSNKLLYSLIGIAVLLILVMVVGKKQGWIGKPKETLVDLVKAQKATIIEKVTASGKVQPVTEVKISPDISGEITELLVKEGDAVEQGQLLIKIKPDTFESALERAKATLNQQKANFADAKARKARSEAQLLQNELEFKRNKKLFDQKAISDADFQAAETNFKVAQQDFKSSKENVKAAQYSVQSAEASVREAAENLSFTSIYAPVTGTISKLDVEKGERVVGTSQMAGTEMLRIADLNQMEARVDVNENDIIRVALGDTAEIDVDSYTYMGKIFKGVVTSIANTANDAVSADAVTEFEVKIKILNDSFKDLQIEKGNNFPFRPGMTTSVEIITKRKENVLTVPISAVAMREPLKESTKEEEKTMEASMDTQNSDEKKAEKKEVVFVNENGTAKMVEVTTGISDFDKIEIKKGLKEGQEIVSGPFTVVSKRLKDGEVIKGKENSE
ncbi:efflux RND transporter periplasmic adaptor subunit, partial [Xanthovirga aplysinae]|uniref:efflux RND transporter periplasmic adaptor subunit n=1 Tax=Xanthovirga aplysinae TaxID=2529853 RepID=UPI0012BD2D11